MVKNNSALRKLIFLSLVIIGYSIKAQSSISSDHYSNLVAFENFQSRNYQGVIGDLNNINNPSKDEEILLLLSKLKTGERNTEAIELWVSGNSIHPIKHLVAFHLGEYYFYEKDTLKSKKHLSSILPTDLATQDRASYGFIYGVLLLGKDNYQKARNLFQFARENQFDQPSKLDYFEAYAHYHLGQKEIALKGFEKVKNHADFGASSTFFIAKIRLENNELDEVLKLAQSELSDEKTITNSGFHQLIGEAHALKNNTAKADAFFERAIELHPSRPSAALYYQAGVSKFKIGNEDKAITFLTEAGIQGGEYAQLSAFQLGRLFLKKRNYEKALSAYIEASVSENKAIKEESYYQAAMINAQLGFFADAINYSSDYLKNFRNGSKTLEIQNLIAQSYLRTSNYDLAIVHLNESGIATNTQKEVYQKVTFQKAILSFNDSKFSEAEKWFKESVRFTPDLNLKNQANFHLAEISMRNGRLDEAIRLYKTQSQLDPLSNYGLGYAYYNKQQYENAASYFRSARNASDKTVKLDAGVRLADCLYATKSYSEALAIYGQLSDQTGAPYLAVQKGMTLKNLGRGSEAVRTFRSVFSSEKYGAEARFQSGMIHFENAQFADAESYFSQVISDFPNSSFIPESILNRGISRKNMGSLDQAKSDYEQILNNYINSEIALNAILGLQELQQTGQQVNSLDRYIADYKKANPESGSLELIEFEAAKRFYFDFSYDQATISFEKFLKDYPSSSNKLEAKYYLADSYYRINKLTEARSAFNELKYVRNSFSGRVLSRLGDINRQLRNVNESQEAYQLLIDLNLSAKDSYNARQGLMLLYYENTQYNDAVKLADEILAADWKPLNGDQEAILIKAKSLFRLGDLKQAENSFNQLAGGKDVFAAKSNYYIALIQFQQNEFEKSLNTLFDLNANFGSYTEWVDQAYLLIARNYIAMDELFQAKATLRSIIQHSKNDGIIKDAQALLNDIEDSAAISDSTQNKN